MSQIEIHNLWKYYDGQLVLENINLDIESGSFVSLIGPSGCGKSTFLRILLGQESTTRGTVTIDGKVLEGEPSVDRGIVFQKYSVFPHLNVLKNVLIGLEFEKSPIIGGLFGPARSRAKEEAKYWIDAVGLSDALKKYPHQLSGGMQQRLAIAQAMIKKPKVLLLDEPFGALDPGIRVEMHELLHNLWEETKMTIVMVSHDLAEAFKLGSRVIVFNRERTRRVELEAYGATITYDVETGQSDEETIAEIKRTTFTSRDDPDDHNAS